MTPVCSVGIMFDLTDVGRNLNLNLAVTHITEENPSEAVHQRG